QSQVVVNNPLQFASPTVGNGKMSKLAINTAICIGAARGPQIVSCTITSFQNEIAGVRQPFEAVAKIYDP
ncbi:hypothetical protein F5883DRAFT_408713, partial [Diaporthe sp. PMI_573]